MPEPSRLIVSALVVLAACSQPPSSPSGSGAAPAASGGDVIATYAGKTFTTEDFRREVERLPPRSRLQITSPERKRQFVDNYILNELLAEKGHVEGFDKDPEIARQVDDLRRRLVVQRVMKDFQEPPAITDAEVQAYYEENKRLFSGAQVRASHILVKDEALARQLRDQLREDPSKFEELAKSNSTDTGTAARGGDLGFFGQGRMVGEFERAAFTLQSPGDITDPVKTPFGWHIIKLTERKEGGDKPFDEVKDRIRVTLLNQRRQEQVNKRFEALRVEANVTVNEEVLVAVELPTALPSPAAGARAGGMGGGLDAAGGAPPTGGH